MKKPKKIEMLLLIVAPIFIGLYFYFTFVLNNVNVSTALFVFGFSGVFLVFGVEQIKIDKAVTYNLKIMAEVINAKISNRITGRVLKGIYKGSPVIVRYYSKGEICTIEKKTKTDDKAVRDFTLVQPTKNTYIEDGQVCWEDKCVLNEKLEKDKIVSFLDELIQAAAVVEAHGPYYNKIK
jgi:hypothetical protein